MLQYFGYLQQYITEWYLGTEETTIENLNAAAEKVKRGVMVDEALKAVGMSREDLEEITKHIQSLSRVGVGFEIGLHVGSLTVGFGTEYVIDRRKNFSFLKAFMYYAATYGFTSAVLQHRIMNTMLSSGNDSLKSLL